MLQDVPGNIRAKERRGKGAAARRLGLTRTDFVLEAACREAERVLLDQTALDSVNQQLN